MPQAICEHFILVDEFNVGSKKAFGVAKMFSKLFDCISEKPDFDMLYEPYAQYIDEVCRQWWQHPKSRIHINFFHNGVFSEIMHICQAKAEAEAKELAQKMGDHLSSLNSASADSSSKSSSNPNHTCGTQSNYYNCNSSTSNSSLSSLSSSFCTPNYSPRGQKVFMNPNICCICGSSDCWYRHYKEAQDNYTKKDGNGWKDRQGCLICISWNRVDGCNCNNCKFLHICSHCGSNTHTAQKYRH
ncbi:hypothetical protein GYMLUDRAFT_65371 [Collybiopsis luxurians FD-317 M1]|uniref:Uncharacterized protein n=1 Tax=Collybiopsis luxurians FD-317 M1 TaxID=944289 RepID=A0A0D0BL89_9AGAR|nr:hypothetical protein GYMLUDRAFT_65371 [Collybiopsis luxurians FD-317 M1]